MSPEAGAIPRSFAAAEDALHEAATALTGLDDFGDERYREPLRRLLTAYDEESFLTDHGRELVWGMLVHVLSNRARVVRDWNRDPTALDTPIRQPIFVLGLPRTGTTALHHLLAQDGRHQVLEHWLGNAPQRRPPVADWPGNVDHERAVLQLEALYASDPSLRTMHLVTADGPDECRLLFLQTLVDDTYESNATVPSYHRWRLDIDMHWVYEWHRDQLKLIGADDHERRWVLKDPPHMRWLDTLLATYPDACIVQAHRDPGRVVPSLCNMTASFRVAFEGDKAFTTDPDWQVEHYLQGALKTIEVREDADPAQFVDVFFDDLVERPIETVKRIYSHFDIELTGTAERAMQDWYDANRKGSHGEHVYNAEDFGMTADAVRERYAAYIDHFDVPIERTS